MITPSTHTNKSLLKEVIKQIVAKQLHPQTLERLSAHDNIAWDIDKTLINNPNQELFYEFIKNNPQKRHVIVTYRTGEMVKNIFNELTELTKDHFDDILGVPEELYYDRKEAESLIQAGNVTPELLKDVSTYRTWKGAICKKHGLTILVDDDRENAENGCKLHGIEFFYSLQQL